MPDFVHLHCHTEYSLLDGAIRIKELCQRVKDLGMPAVAVTDHGGMFGAVTFANAARAVGVKPIIGCEVYVAQGGMADKSEKGQLFHLVLLAKNNEGYRNLVQLVSKAHLFGFHYKPRVDKELLRGHSEGLIALSACLAGELCRALAQQGLDAGEAVAREYAAIFPGRYYLEVQANGLAEQERVNALVVETAKRTGLPLVATNDCHYLSREDAEAHDLLLCIQTQTTVDAERRMRMGTEELYVKAPEEMEAAFAHLPEALANSVRIAEECAVEIERGVHHFPTYTLPEGVSVGQELRRLAREGLGRRLAATVSPVDEKAYRDRLEHELGVIEQTGFETYFLIVQDFINWAKDHGIPVGPGRGSAAGSLAAYALRITNLDPLPYGLLFERFLNSERVSLPDIDVDFCERRRAEVIRYVSQKYGEDHVAQITTFGTMKARAVVRDVGRALGMTFAETDRIAKLIPDDQATIEKLLDDKKAKVTIDNAVRAVPELAQMVAADPRVAKLVDISRRLEGLSRHASTHAAGVVISDKPLADYVPLYRGKKDEVVTQYDMKRVEEIGLIKFDFLGLRTMTVIDDCQKLIAEQGGKVPDLDRLSLDDRKTYEVFARGDTDGIFQVESAGMRRYLRMLKPTCFEDLIAMLALYRPGPLGSGMVEEFIKRKHGQIKVSYPHPTLEATLSPTYGVIVYQEQVMQTARVVASYSLGEGDLLRRAMGKKKPEEMAKQRQRFMEGARANKIPEPTARHIFDLMEKFAEYGFNKSHSAAYALIAYYTAYLKAHFPVEFMAALISSELANADKVFKYINACREMDIAVLPPDVNQSAFCFSVRQGAILFGLGGVRNVGEEAVSEILEERKAGGPFTDLTDFCRRANLRRITKRVVEYLIKSGAMDCFSSPRAGLMAQLDRAVALGQRKAKERASGMLSMLDMLGQTRPEAEPALRPGPEALPVGEWSDEEKLRLEKEAIGFFLSSHPLLAYRDEMRRMRLTPLDDCRELADGTEVQAAVLVTARKEYITKNQEKMAFCDVEDLSGTGELTLLPNTYALARAWLEQDMPLCVSARVDRREVPGEEENSRTVKLTAQKVAPLAEAAANNAAPFEIELAEAACAGERLARLKDILTCHPGPAPVVIRIRRNGSVCVLRLSDRHRVGCSKELRREIEAWQTLAGPACRA
jgi:DNA polymerase-3 subunit alpha